MQHGVENVIPCKEWAGVRCRPSAAVRTSPKLAFQWSGQTEKDSTAPPAKPEWEPGEEGKNIALLKGWRLRRMPFSNPPLPFSSSKLHVYAPSMANTLLNVDLKV